MKQPSPSVPFVEYVLRAMEHPPCMFVSKLAACCTILFLTRSDPELLRELCFKWAVRFQRDRETLISIIRRRSLVCGRGEDSGGSCIPQSEEDPDVYNAALRLCNPDAAVEHLLRILNSLVMAYFSWNWHRTDYVIQINKEYEAYVRENILPICVATPAEEGIDDTEESAWLLSPTDYLSGPLPSSGSFYNNNARRESRAVGGPSCEAEPTATGEVRGPTSPAGAAAVVAVTATSEIVTANSSGSAKDAGAARPPTLRADESLPDEAATPRASSLAGSGPLRSFAPPPAPLALVTLSNFQEALMRNKDGLVIVFHAKYCAKSNEVLEAFREIASQELLSPMPEIAVAYTVAEPELAALYNVSWFPTIVYTPPPTTRRRKRVLRRSAPDANDSLAERAPAEPLQTTDQGQGSTTPTSATAAASLTVPKALARKASGASASNSALALPEGPSPTQVLYGFKVQKEGRCSTPAGSKLSPTGRSAGLFSPTSTGSLPALGHGGADGSGCPGATGGAEGTAEPASSRRLSSSRSCSSTSVLPDHVAEELRAAVREDGHKVYPMNGVVSIPSLVEWISSRGEAQPKVRRVNDSATRVSALRAGEKYKKFRELRSAVVMLRLLQGDTGKGGSTAAHGGIAGSKRAGLEGPASNADSSLSAMVSGSSSTGEPPMFIFLGGGMAAGKTTAAMALAHSAWWKHHRDKSVLVNADEFKLTESAFDEMRAEVHSRSTRAAESLLVQAINQGRSIVFDGTMMWAPFVHQVIDMVRNAHTQLYKQGPGYRGPHKPEIYFVPSAVRPTPLPHAYVIRFLGITVEPQIAVPRGFLRKFSTGRGVPISTQLRSFKLFAENFSGYAKLVDSATLYNNNVFVNLEKGELPPVIAEKDEESPDGALKIYDEAAWQLFMQQKQLNEDADNVLELYPAFSAASSPVRRREGSMAGPR